ncbi:MAG: helix-turn-helix domain-containing protein [Candidatus Sericytochromatia bacterium]
MDNSKKNENSETLLKKQNVLEKEFLTLEEAADYLSLSKSAMYKMTSKKEIPFYNPGGKKIYFKREELNNWIISSKVYSSLEVELDVTSYLSRNNKNLKL